MHTHELGLVTVSQREVAGTARVVTAASFWKEVHWLEKKLPRISFCISPRLSCEGLGVTGTGAPHADTVYWQQPCQPGGCSNPTVYCPLNTVILGQLLQKDFLGSHRAALGAWEEGMGICSSPSTHAALCRLLQASW